MKIARHMKNLFYTYSPTCALYRVVHNYIVIQLYCYYSIAAVRRSLSQLYLSGHNWRMRQILGVDDRALWCVLQLMPR